MEVINLYTANEQELQTLPNIGDATATKIIQLREAEELNWQNLARNSRVSADQWESWYQEGRISLDKQVANGDKDLGAAQPNGHDKELNGHQSPGDIKEDLKEKEDLTEKEALDNNAQRKTNAVGDQSVPPYSGFLQNYSLFSMGPQFCFPPPPGNGPLHHSLSSWNPQRQIQQGLSSLSVDHHLQQIPETLGDDSRAAIPGNGIRRPPVNDSLSSNGLSFEEARHRAMIVCLEAESTVSKIDANNQRWQAKFRAEVESWMKESAELEKNRRESDRVRVNGLFDRCMGQVNQQYSLLKDQIHSEGERVREDFGRVYSSFDSLKGQFYDGLGQVQRELRNTTDRLYVDMDAKFAEHQRQFDLKLRYQTDRPPFCPYHPPGEYHEETEDFEDENSDTESPMSAKETINKSYRDLGLEASNGQLQASGVTSFKPMAT